MATNYLKKILSARVYDVAKETELELAPELSKRLGNQVLLKREDNQPVFSFKLRGAYNKMAHLPPEALKRGVIAASAGNHAQGVALSAAKMKCKAVIVMPVTTPSVKIDAVKARGGSWVEVILHGESYSDAFKHSEILEKKRGLTFVHPFDDPDVIAGQPKLYPINPLLTYDAGCITTFLIRILSLKPVSTRCKKTVGRLEHPGNFSSQVFIIPHSEGCVLIL